MTLSLPPPTQKLVNPQRDIEEPWYRYWARANSAINEPKRIKLEADTTVYVATTGSDTTGDGTSANPFATPQAAYDYICGDIDLGGFNATISIADGTYTAASIASRDHFGDSFSCVIFMDHFVNGTLFIVGNVTTPSNVVFSCASNYGIFGSWEANNGIFVKGIRFNGAGGVGIFNNAPALWCALDDVEFGNLYAGCQYNTGELIIYKSSVTFNGTISRSGIWLEALAYLDMEQSTITCTSSPSFATAFLEVSGRSKVIALNNTYTGAATGKRYLVSGHVYNDSGNLPGNANGETIQGGTYIGSGSDLTKSGLGEYIGTAAALDVYPSATQIYSETRLKTLAVAGGEYVRDIYNSDETKNLGFFRLRVDDITSSAEACGWRFGTIQSGATGTRMAIRGGVIIGSGSSDPGAGNLALSTGQAFASLPASPAKGMIAVVTNSSTATWGATVGGGGATSVLAWYNGTNWTVIGS